MRRPYEFALVQLTRFRPVRGVLRTVSTDSIVLHQLRRIRNTYRITNVVCSRQSGGCVGSPFSTVLVGAIINRPGRQWRKQQARFKP